MILSVILFIMKYLKLKTFHKWSKDERVTDDEINDAIDEFNDGNKGDSLGGGLYKKRIPLPGTNKGKRGGARAIIFYKVGKILVFILGFNKTDVENISGKQKKKLKLFGKEISALTENKYNIAIKHREIIEIKRSSENE